MLNLLFPRISAHRSTNAETQHLVEGGLFKIHGLDVEESQSVSHSLHGFMQAMSLLRHACSDRIHLKIKMSLQTRLDCKAAKQTGEY